ncbi:hypothetical protein IX51_01370 [uncultured archaeon]|nr:hypothetical protein IX51_01370 [uncultured archaeon]
MPAGKLVAPYIDLLIAMPILKDVLPSLSLVFPGVAIASFVLFLSLPFHMLSLFSRAAIRADRSAVRYLATLKTS